jgi:hypothetical protein
MSTYTYTITLSDDTKVEGLLKFDYGGHTVYGKETNPGSNSFFVKDIYFMNMIKEITAVIAE